MPINVVDEKKVDDLIEDKKVKEYYKKYIILTDKFDKLLCEICNMPDTIDPSIKKKILIKELREKKNYREIENIIFREKNKLLQSHKANNSKDEGPPFAIRSHQNLINNP